MRLFTGLGLPPHIIANLDGKFAGPASNLHITTKFIGEWPPDRLPELLLTLERIPRPGAPSIRMNGLGMLSHALVVMVEPTPQLITLAADTDTALVPLGLAPETRPYTPHITLARRFKGKIPHDPELQGEFEATEFFLYESKMSVYTRVAAFPLK
jgi:RNA 2',3'-cyclic 3'-phosphodiesterase